MPKICNTDLKTINRLLRQCAAELENSTHPTSPARDLARRCNLMRKKLLKKIVPNTNQKE